MRRYNQNQVNKGHFFAILLWVQCKQIVKSQESIRGLVETASEIDLLGLFSPLHSVEKLPFANNQIVLPLVSNIQGTAVVFGSLDSPEHSLPKLANPKPKPNRP